MQAVPAFPVCGAQFGVIQVHLYGHIYEVATFRSDRDYLDGRHPSSVAFSGPEQDAQRRDFTINGLFYDPVADRLIDYVHGRNDIQNRIIRTIGTLRRALRKTSFACCEPSGLRAALISGSRPKLGMPFSPLQRMSCR